MMKHNTVHVISIIKPNMIDTVINTLNLSCKVFYFQKMFCNKYDIRRWYCLLFLILRLVFIDFIFLRRKEDELLECSPLISSKVFQCVLRHNKSIEIDNSSFLSTSKALLNAITLDIFIVYFDDSTLLLFVFKEWCIGIDTKGDHNFF